MNTWYLNDIFIWSKCEIRFRIQDSIATEEENGGGVLEKVPYGGAGGGGTMPNNNKIHNCVSIFIYGPFPNDDNKKIENILWKCNGSSN